MMDCDGIARVYRWLEYASFGGALRRRRVAFLAQTAAARRVLMLGDGDGRFLAAFLRENPEAEVDSVDCSARMLELAQARVSRLTGAAGAQSRVRFHQADALDWRPPAGASYDLIVTHFFLDCFGDDDLGRIVPLIAAAATPSAAWLVSEFRQPERGMAAWRARIWIGCLYAAFRVLTGLEVGRLPDYRKQLESHGFVLEREESADGGLLTSQLWKRANGAERRC